MKEDYVNPEHYRTESGKQVWELMIENFGVGAFFNFCVLNVFKYEQRAGKKTTEDSAYDLAKAKWYRDKANEIRQHHTRGEHPAEDFFQQAEQDFMNQMSHRDIVERQYGNK